MPVVLRFLGAVLGAIVTLFFVGLMTPLLVLATPFLNAILFPFISGSLVLIFFSYIFTYALRISGEADQPWSQSAQIYEIVYLIVCTCIILLTVRYIIMGLLLSGLSTLFIVTIFILIGALASILFIALYAIPVLLGYIFAAIFAPVHGGIEDSRECFWRGALIGGNTVMNVVLSLIFYGWLFSPYLNNPVSFIAGIPAVVIVAAGIFIIILANCLTLIPSTQFYLPASIRGNVQDFVKAYAGYVSWLMPMSWGYCILGCILFYFSWIGHLIAIIVLNNSNANWLITAVQYWGISRLLIDPQTGTMVTENGGCSNFSSPGSPSYPYSCGCFAFIPDNFSSRCYIDNAIPRQHESGHALNLAAFGSVYNMINAINEEGLDILGIHGLGQNIHAYGDRTAQSNVDDDLILNAWDPQNKHHPEVEIWR